MEESILYFINPSRQKPMDGEGVLCVINFGGVYSYIVALYVGQKFLKDGYSDVTMFVIEWASLTSLGRFENKA